MLKDYSNGLFNPVWLETGKTKLFVEDYFIDIAVSPFLETDNIQCIFDKHRNEIILNYQLDKIPFLSLLGLKVKEQYYYLLLKKTLKQQHTFIYKTKYHNVKSVCIAGDFNNWNASSHPLKKNENNEWTIDLMINPGAYQYQLIIDNQWKLDETNPNKVANNLGGTNSLFDVPFLHQNKIPIITTKRFLENNISVQFENEVSEYFIFLNNHLLEEPYHRISDKTIEITIPDVYYDIERTFIRVYACNEFGISNDILIPLSFGKVINSKEQLTRYDHHSKIIYFLIVDRFAKSDECYQPKKTCENIHPKADFYGGNLAGLLNKVKNNYFYDLGVNTLWITPLFKVPKKCHQEFAPPHKLFAGYHGYWPISSDEIDDRFGSRAQLKELVENMHEQGMNLLIDFVANHVHEDHPIIKANPHWATSLYLPDGRLNIHLWDEQRLTTWFDIFLPTLDYSNPEVVEYMLSVALFWLKYYDLDGFRHDATKHVPITFWRALTKSIRKWEKENNTICKTFQIGETFGSRELIDSFVGCGLQNSQFDFNLYYAARSAFALEETSFITLHKSLKDSLLQFGYHSLMGNISGNHDMPRFISIAGGSISLSENPIEAGWNREITVGDKIAYKKLACLHAFNYTIPGVPVVFYGDEIGLPGGGDPDNRRPMKFNKLSFEEKLLKFIVSKLGKWRQGNMSLIFGDIQFIHTSETQFCYARKYFDEISIVIFSKSKRREKINIPINVDYKGLYQAFSSDAFVNLENTISIELEPYTFEIFRKIKT